MKRLIQRRLVWLALLMLWVGMVLSISNYGTFHGGAYETTLDEITIEVGDIVEEQVPSLIKTSSDSGDFFVNFRLEREQARSETLEILKDLLENPETDKEIKRQAQEKILNMTSRIEREMEIESLIKARGYAEALAFLHNEAVDIIIQTNGLEREDVARIGDIVAKATGIRFSNITIIEKMDQRA